MVFGRISFLESGSSVGWIYAVHVVAFIQALCEVAKKFMLGMWDTMESRSWDCCSSADASPEARSIHFPALFCTCSLAVQNLVLLLIPWMLVIGLMKIFLCEASAHRWDSGFQTCQWWVLCWIRCNSHHLEQSQLLCVKLYGGRQG